MRFDVHAASRTLAAIVAVTGVHVYGAAAEPGARAKAGSCAAFVKHVEQVDGAGLTRRNLYDGLSGWIAKKGEIDPAEVDALAQTVAPDASACASFALAPEVLRALETVVVKVPADKVREAVETCLADLRLLDEIAEGPRQATLLALDSAQARNVGRLLGFLSRDVKPAPGAVEARQQALRDGAGADLRGVALGAALSTCEPFGVEVASLRLAHAAGQASR